MIALFRFYLNTPTPDNRVFYQGVTICLLLTCRLLGASSASAQIYQCGETWTNQPCPGASPVFKEIVSTQAPVSMLTQQKRDAIHQLTSARYEAREKFGVSIDAGDIERLCEYEQTTLEQCRSAIEEFRHRLDTRVIEAERLTLERQRLAERHDAPQGDNNSQVVIINNLYRATPSIRPPYPPYVAPNSGLIHQVPPPKMATAPSRGEVAGDARVPLPGQRR